jgi:hypothetical protein
MFAGFFVGLVVGVWQADRITGWIEAAKDWIVDHLPPL